MKRHILYPIIAILLLAACSKNETDHPCDKGRGTLLMSGIAVDEATRVVSTSDFIVTIYDGNNEQIESWTAPETPEAISLPAGIYTVTAHSNTLSDAAWESPYYFGSQTAAVEDDRTTQVTVNCTLENIKVAVAYSEDLRAALGENYSTRITVGDAWLDFENGEQRAGFFRAAEKTNTMRIDFSGIVDGVQENFSMEIDNVKAGQFRRITLTISSQSGDHDLGAEIQHWQQDPELEAGK